MANPTQLEEAIDAAIEKHATQLREALAGELKTLLAAAGTAGGSAALYDAFRCITAADSQTEILQRLLAAAGSFASRSAVLIVKGEKLVGWRGRGFAQSEKVRSLSLAAEGEAGWRQAAQHAPGAGDAAPAAAPLAQQFFSLLGPPADSRAYLFPLTVHDRAVAVLYGDAGEDGGRLDVHGLELLAGMTGMYLEVWSARPHAGVAPSAAPAVAEAAASAAPMEAVPAPLIQPVEPRAPEPAVVLEPAPAPAAAAAARAPAGPDLAGIPESEHDVHKKAFRFAKLLVDDLILYNKAKIEQGMAQRDVYAAIKDDIDKSRAAYEKKWGKTPAGKTDYFHQLLVLRVAQGDPTVLGSDYPGPLV
jgi:hypothetical protein